MAVKNKKVKVVPECPYCGSTHLKIPVKIKGWITNKIVDGVKSIDWDIDGDAVKDFTVLDKKRKISCLDCNKKLDYH